MKSSITTALGIALQIWFVAILLNTLIDVVFLFGLKNGIAGIATVAFFVFLIGGIFTIPIFLLLWSIADLKLHEGSSVTSIFTILIITGSLLTCMLLALLIFIFGLMDKEIYYAALVALGSGILSIVFSYPAIKNACHVRNTARMQIINFNVE